MRCHCGFSSSSELVFFGVHIECKVCLNQTRTCAVRALSSPRTPPGRPLPPRRARAILAPPAGGDRARRDRRATRARIRARQSVTRGRLDLVLVEEHVGDAVVDGEAPAALGADERALDDVDLRRGPSRARRRGRARPGAGRRASQSAVCTRRRASSSVASRASGRSQPAAAAAILSASYLTFGSMRCTKACGGGPRPAGGAPGAARARR